MKSNLFVLTLVLLSAGMSFAQTNPDFEEYYKTDVFTESEVQFDIDGFIDPKDKHQSEIEYKKFEQKCLFEVPNRQRNLLYSLSTYNPEIDINDFGFSTKVEIRDFQTQKSPVCRISMKIAQNARYLITRNFSEVFKGKKSEQTCMDRIGQLEGRQEELGLLSRRAFVMYKKRFGKYIPDLCQVMYVTLKANPNYNPNPDCNSNNEFTVSLSAQKFDMDRLPQTVLPYHAYSKPVLKVTTIEENAFVSPEYNAKYYKNTMLLVSFLKDADSIPWDQVADVKEAKLVFDYTKYVSDSYNDTEVLCTLAGNPEFRACSGQLFYERLWKDLKNFDFFSFNKDVKGNAYSKLFPKGVKIGTVLSGSSQFDMKQLYNDDQIVNSLRNGGFDMVFADDTYVKSGAQIKIKFACNPK